MKGNITPNEHENAVVIYDKEGIIRHVHTVLTVGDTADGRSREDVEAVALKVAAQFGHKVDDMQAMTVKTDDLKKNGMRVRVDVANRALVPDERSQ